MGTDPPAAHDGCRAEGNCQIGGRRTSQGCREETRHVSHIHRAQPRAGSASQHIGPAVATLTRTVEVTHPSRRRQSGRAFRQVASRLPEVALITTLLMVGAVTSASGFAQDPPLSGPQPRNSPPNTFKELHRERGFARARRLTASREMHQRRTHGVVCADNQLLHQPLRGWLEPLGWTDGGDAEVGHRAARCRPVPVALAWCGMDQVAGPDPRLLAFSPGPSATIHDVEDLFPRVDVPVGPRPVRKVDQADGHPTRLLAGQQLRDLGLAGERRPRLGPDLTGAQPSSPSSLRRRGMPRSTGSERVCSALRQLSSPVGNHVTSQPGLR